jgi:hypothetical protein
MSEQKGIALEVGITKIFLPDRLARLMDGPGDTHDGVCM